MKGFSFKLRIMAALTAIFLFSACVSTMTIGEDLSPAELIQRAQEASDRNRYNMALQYYKALLERNRGNADLVITAEYEIAFINYKRGNYPLARSQLNSVLEYYDTPDEELLPRQFKRLAQIVLDNITEKENRRMPFFWRKSTINENRV
jgi:outer membrane protein assembly factor BamD (BamD/ComL family)